MKTTGLYTIEQTPMQTNENFIFEEPKTRAVQEVTQVLDFSPQKIKNPDIEEFKYIIEVQR